MAKRKTGLRGTLVFPARGTSSDVDKSISEATNEIKETIYKSVGGLDVEINKTASVTANGTVVVEPSDGKDAMEKATVTVAVPLEANKTTTIDASQYDSPVEITPTSGNTAMQKATVTVENIPVLETNKTASITSNGTVEITPTSGKDAMEKATVTVEVPSADLENNKNATIDVSAYTDPVEITPTAGKDGMKKTTVTLSNIPSGGSGNFTAYKWISEDVGYPTVYTSFGIAPDNADNEKMLKHSDSPETYYVSDFLGDIFSTYSKNSDTSFTVNNGKRDITYTRDDPTNDLIAWTDELESNKAQTIDVSQYLQPIEIEPTAGKDGMRKATITLSNIPSGGATLYAWNEVYGGGDNIYTNFDIAPDSIQEDDTDHLGLTFDEYPDVRVYTVSHLLTITTDYRTYSKVSNTSFEVLDDQSNPVYVYNRDSTKDITLWQLPTP